MKASSTILVVEDQQQMRQRIAYDIDSFLGIPYAKVLQAGTLDEARKLFAEHQERIIAICLDGCVLRPDDLDSLPLIKEFLAAGFKGPIVAMSSFEGFRDQMIAAGCTHSEVKGRVGALLETLFATQ